MVEFSHSEFQRFLRSEQNLKEKSTLQNYQSGLSRFDDFLQQEGLDIDDVDSTDIKIFMSETAGDVSDATTSSYMTAVRKFYNHHLSDGAPNPVDYAPTESLDADEVQHTKPTLEIEQVKELVDSAHKKRAHAMLSLMASSGMRLREACQAKLSNLDLENRYVDIMTVKNDFGRRDAYFDRKTRRLLNEYINMGYRDKYANADSDYIFLPKSYGQYNGEGHLSTDRGREDFRTAVTNSSIEPDKEQYGDGRERWTLTTHVLRRSFAQHWIDKNGDLLSLRNQLGWESVETARAYISDESTQKKHNNYGVQL